MLSESGVIWRVKPDGPVLYALAEPLVTSKLAATAASLVRSKDLLHVYRGGQPAWRANKE